MPLLNLNTEQLQAATCKEGFNLIIASAGTGKTSTIVGRISHLLNNNVKPHEIMLVTFTNKASTEMISRISKFFGNDISKDIVAGTFHSISYKLLKQLGLNIVLKQQNELKTLFKSIYEKRTFSNNQNESSPYDGGYLYDLYSLYLNSNEGEDFSSWISSKNPMHSSYSLIYEDVVDEFNELKKKYFYVNFDDLLVTMLETLKKTKFNFKEILVDEYQDTNSLQGRLLDAFQSKSLFCVGDYDQSIYAFNGSNIEIISTFSKRYKDANIFTLKKNYRSTQPILNLANSVINNNERIYEKKLEVIRTQHTSIPKLLEFDELFSQYAYISKLISQSQTKHDEIAVIFRNNSSADGIEASLREFGIPSKRKGGVSFFDSVEVKFILDILMMELSHDDMMAFIHILEYGKGIGKSIAKDIFDALIKLGDGNIQKGLFSPKLDILNPFDSKIKNQQLGLFDDFIELGSISKFKDCEFEEQFLSNPILKHPKLTIDGAKYIYDYYLLSKNLRRIKNPESMISNIISSSIYLRLKEFLSIKRSMQKDGSINESQKEKALYKINRKTTLLLNLAKNFNNLSKFINSMILGGSEMSEGSGVNLLSVHASKGLEFTEVYIIDLMDGRFPNRKLMSKGGSIEEERRLFYVAVTRAKDILYLSYSKYDKIKKISFAPSPFLKEAKLIN